MLELLAFVSCFLSIFGYYLAFVSDRLILGISLKIIACGLDFYYFTQTQSLSRFLITFFYLAINLSILAKLKAPT